MLMIGRSPGKSVVLTDSGGRQMTVRLSDLVRDTGYASLHVIAGDNHFAVTLAPGMTLPMGPTLQFEADVEITNRSLGPVPTGDVRLAFNIPPSVKLVRSEMLGRVESKGSVN